MQKDRKCLRSTQWAPDVCGLFFFFCFIRSGHHGLYFYQISLLLWTIFSPSVFVHMAVVWWAFVAAWQVLTVVIPEPLTAQRCCWASAHQARCATPENCCGSELIKSQVQHLLKDFLPQRELHSEPDNIPFVPPPLFPDFRIVN